MKRATITFPDALEQKLNDYLSRQRTPPSISTVVQTALGEYLEQQKWAAYDLHLASRSLEVTVAEEGRSQNDVSLHKSRYTAEATYAHKVAATHRSDGHNEG